ncbi:MAG: hypothetical protein P9M03_10280 [Candidatus Theseobacter exili]|nr:hypothetical protein [Candidatus Theseobacter exili]
MEYVSKSEIGFFENIIFLFEVEMPFLYEVKLNNNQIKNSSLKLVSWVDSTYKKMIDQGTAFAVAEDADGESVPYDRPYCLIEKM